MTEITEEMAEETEEETTAEVTIKALQVNLLNSLLL